MDRGNSNYQRNKWKNRYKTKPSLFSNRNKKGQSILEAAPEQKLSLNYKCKKGTCGKCKVMAVNGRNDLQ
ncbi:2Fe-2S iron-sulfur cluster-binding protein [Schinkia azotoformans]|uniref:2Fe-2S iron-sulfur cluster-binding protein n=1 Tax=Schinkia azotoformans TaxID=1454 RepID=UPI00398A81E0